MNLYELATQVDILDALSPMFETGACWIEMDGSIKFNMKVKHYQGFVLFNSDPNRKCLYNLDILFPYLLGRKGVPSRCHECWKVVAAPKNLNDLFFLYAYMQKMGFNSKCGIETDRPNTPRMYAGYFYCDSKEEGLATLERVWEEINLGVEDFVLKLLGNIFPVKLKESMSFALKRGCTEYEQFCGPSDKWNLSDSQINYEKMCWSYIGKGYRESAGEQPEIVKTHIIRKWIKSAAKWGDETHKLFCDTALMPEIKKYGTW